MSVQDVQATAIPSKEFRFTSADGLSVAYARWDSRAPLRGVVQIAHGMGEHIGRYAELIEALVSAGFTVYGNDHRGHGRTAPSPQYFGDFGKGGFGLLVEDMVRLSRIARQENPKQPFFLLGHGMGSFAAQLAIIDHGAELDGLLLSGSGALDRIERQVSSARSGRNVLNAPFEPARTPFDWLSRDTAVVDAYISDPLCFATLKPAALASFLGAADCLSNPASLRKIPDGLPIYLFSGSEDPVGEQTVGMHILMERYRNAGLYDVFHEFYPGGRHEMLNEINRDEVRADLLGWIRAVLSRRQGSPEAAVVA